MVIIIIAGIIGFCLGGVGFGDYSYSYGRMDIGGWLKGLFGALAGLWIGCIFGYLVAVVLGWVFIQPEVETNTWEQELASLGDTTYEKAQGEIGGGGMMVHYIRGYLTTTSDNAYKYYIKVGDSFKLETLPADNVTIKYTDGTPKLVNTDYVCKRGFEVLPFAVRPCWIDKGSSTHIFYVPEGSIRSEYNLGS